MKTSERKRVIRGLFLFFNIVWFEHSNKTRIFALIIIGIVYWHGKVGYIFKANSYDAFDADKEWMLQYGCVQVIEESVKHETLRPKWKQLMSNLERGDELVVSKFSNAVRGLRELAALIELCRIKVVRIISIHDKIDTCNELFAETTPAEVLMMFGALPEEVAVLRKSSDKIMRLQQSINTSILTKRVWVKRNGIRRLWICITTVIQSGIYGKRAVSGAKVQCMEYSISTGYNLTENPDVYRD